MPDGIYEDYKRALHQGEVDVLTDDIRLMLVNDYVPNFTTHTRRSHVTGEVVGTGYTTGGSPLASKVINISGSARVFDAADVSWPSSTITADGGVLYKNSGAGAANDQLIGYFDFGSDRSSSSGTFTVQFNSNGIISIA